MSRIYQTQETIDSAKIQSFFNSRAKKEASAVDAVMLQSAGSTIASDRNAYECEHLLPRPALPVAILELGCGAGRIALAYRDAGHRYMGLDFSQELILRAKAENGSSEHIQFQVAEVPFVEAETLKIQPPYDLVIVTALLLYLNDEAVLKTFELISKLSAPSSQIYIRESLSDIDVRLTLKEHFSEELGDTYNAIYRTTDELRAVMQETLIAEGFSYSVNGEYAFPPALRNRAETAQKYFLLNR
ncbi:class I SAM-dependent methyltransferase [Agrobacterium larrymoorei]|uniref:SAM-dependent methyltransferase n=1 Tax=Agrobacterium larrymoorei TaxID=160699 RepID=A0ABU0UK45_9HYPH|nr:class I SAM-dependent methyltransferase [Agrobacterium larrymoorei]MDQ1185321.1 SAM-dependent methyltransferase [Agrobacterium larrymoorei]